MTHEEYIKTLSRKELAILLVNTSLEPDYEVPFMQEIHVTSDRMEFIDDYDSALEHECWWLAQDRKEEEI